MKTTIVKISKDDIYNNDDLKKCADILANGGVGAFPTETVYGLGGNGLSPDAVKKIYSAKGRPSDNPLILHISSIDMLHTIANNINEKSRKLIDAFWPGALTLIFDKKDIVPFETSGGLDTVAVRFPSNEIAKELIRLSNVPIAAPSANLSGKPSPTRFSHVEHDLLNKVDFIIDGGSCQNGLESTIIDCTRPTPVILRPGCITIDMIETIIGDVELDKSLLTGDAKKALAPGMKYTHYSPKAEVIIVDSKNIPARINYLAQNTHNKKVGILCEQKNVHLYDNEKYVIQILNDANLYHALRKFDFLNTDIVYAEMLENSNDNLAIINRLSKSASFNIIN